MQYIILYSHHLHKIVGIFLNKIKFVGIFHSSWTDISPKKKSLMDIILPYCLLAFFYEQEKKYKDGRRIKFYDEWCLHMCLIRKIINTCALLSSCLFLSTRRRKKIQGWKKG